jgi:hypothetical protein
MIAVGGVDQLDGYPQATAGLADAAFKNAGNPKSPTDMGNIRVLAFERERRCAGRNLEAADLCQGV